MCKNGERRGSKKVKERKGRNKPVHLLFCLPVDTESFVLLFFHFPCQCTVTLTNLAAHTDWLFRRQGRMREGI